MQHMAQVPVTARDVQRISGRNNLLFGVHLFMLGGFVSLVGYLVALCHHLI